MFVSIGFELPTFITISLVLSIGSFFLLRYFYEDESQIYFLILPVISLILSILGFVFEVIKIKPVDFSSYVYALILIFAMSTSIAIDILIILVLIHDRIKSKHKKKV